MTIKINYNKCCWKDGKCISCSCKSTCEGCVEVCPTKALKKGKIIEIEKDKCINCGACITACKHDAISLN
jgi:ferredoxin